MVEADVAPAAERVYVRKAVKCVCTDCQLTILLPTLRLVSDDDIVHPLRLAWGHEDFNGAEVTFYKGALFTVVETEVDRRLDPFQITASEDAAGIVGPHLPEFGEEPGQIIWLCSACIPGGPASKRQALGY